MSLIACGGVPATSEAPASTSTVSRLELDIYVDRSCSPSDEELRSTLGELQRQLPLVVTENGITRVNYLEFGVTVSDIRNMERRLQRRRRLWGNLH